MLIIPSERSKERAEITPTSVTQGKTNDNNEQTFAAAHAIDGDLSTMAATEIVNGAVWLKLQFDRSHFINKIIVYSRFYTDWYYPTSGCVSTESNYRGCVDNENNVVVSVYQGEVKQKSCGTLQLKYGLEQSDQIYTLICNTKGDTVKLSKNTGKIVVTEVAVSTGTGKQ